MKKQVLKSLLGYLVITAMLVTMLPVFSVSAADAPVFLSPADGMYLELNEPVVVKVSTTAANLTIKANETDLTAADNGDGTFSATWIPTVSEGVTITAETSTGSSSIYVIVLDSSTDVYNWNFTDGTADAPMSPNGNEKVWAALSGSLVASSDERGNYGKIANANNQNTYIMYRGTPAIGNVYIFETDVMFDGTSRGLCYYLNSNTNYEFMIKENLLWVPVLGKNVNFSGDINKWYKLKVVVDFVNSDYDVYVNDSVVLNDVDVRGTGFTVANVSSTLKYPQGQISSDDGTQNAYVDNISVRNAAVPTPASITFASPVSGSLLEQGHPVALQATVDGSASKVEFYANDTLVGDGSADSNNVYTYKWSPETTGDIEVYAKLTDKYGNVSKTDAIDVKVLETTVNGNWDFNSQSIEEFDAVSFASGSASYVQLTDGYGYSLKQSNSQANETYAAFNAVPVTNLSVFECEMYFDKLDADHAIYLTSRQSDGTKNLELGFKNGNISLAYDPWTTISTYKPGEWFKLKVIFNNDTLTKDIYINDVQVVLDEPRQISSKSGDFRLFYRYASAIKDVSVYYDNVSVRTVTVPAEVSEITVNSGAQSLAGEIKASETENIMVSFNKMIKADTLGTIKLYKGIDNTAAVNIDPVLSDDGLTVTIPVELEEASSYTIYLTDVKSTDGLSVSNESKYSFGTIAETKGAYNGKFFVGSNEIDEISGLASGTDITFAADVLNPDNEETWVIIAYFENENNGRILKTVEITKVTSPSENVQNLSVSMELSEAPDVNDSICGYVWNNGLIPLCDGFEVPYKK